MASPFVELEVGERVVKVSRSETIRGLRGDGRDGSPYVQLGAIGGVAYVGAVVALRLRG